MRFRAQGLLNGVAVGPLVGRNGLLHYVQERTVEVAVVGCAGIPVRDKSEDHLAGAHRDPGPVTYEIPAIRWIRGLRRNTGARDLGSGPIQEFHLDLSAVHRRLGQRSNAPAEHDRQCLSIQFCGRVPCGQEIDGLLGKAFFDGPCKEIRLAFEGGR